DTGNPDGVHEADVDLLIGTQRGRVLLEPGRRVGRFRQRLDMAALDILLYVVTAGGRERISKRRHDHGHVARGSRAEPDAQAVIRCVLNREGRRHPFGREALGFANRMIDRLLDVDWNARLEHLEESWFELHRPWIHTLRLEDAREGLRQLCAFNSRVDSTLEG